MGHMLYISVHHLLTRTFDRTLQEIENIFFMCIPVRKMFNILHNIMHCNTVRMCVRACVRAWVRACVRACVPVWLI